jgi:transposase
LNQLFPTDDIQPTTASNDPPPLYVKRRLRTPVRDQMLMRPASLDQELPHDHPVRFVWALVEKIDFSQWLKLLRAVEGGRGRAGNDPRLLLAIWVWATVESESSARHVNTLCRDHVAYRWLCGGVSMNYHSLSDFRSLSEEQFEDVIVQIVGSLMNAGLVSLKRLAQDGMKVRASAGKSSFRRSETLAECLQEAREHLAELRARTPAESAEFSQREQAAQARAARENVERLEQAIAECEQLSQQNAAARKERQKPPRVSTTDPEARIMKFSDNGFRPGYNVHFASDAQSSIIVGDQVTNAGTDHGQLGPMMDQIEQRFGAIPEELLVDGGCATQTEITTLAQRGVKVFSPVKNAAKELAAGKDPYARKRDDTDEVADWRTRMGEAVSQELYKLRSQVAEWVNAVCRNHDFRQLLVRGLKKSRSVSRLHVITHDLLHGERLRIAAAEASG